jgi:hypothetical protein
MDQEARGQKVYAHADLSEVERRNQEHEFANAVADAESEVEAEAQKGYELTPAEIRRIAETMTAEGLNAQDAIDRFVEDDARAAEHDDAEYGDPGEQDPGFDIPFDVPHPEAGARPAAGEPGPAPEEPAAGAAGPQQAGGEAATAEPQQEGVTPKRGETREIDGVTVVANGGDYDMWRVAEWGKYPKPGQWRSMSVPAGNTPEEAIANWRSYEAAKAEREARESTESADYRRLIEKAKAGTLTEDDAEGLSRFKNGRIATAQAKGILRAMGLRATDADRIVRQTMDVATTSGGATLYEAWEIVRKGQKALGVTAPKSEPGAEGLPQLVLPGAERSAKQALASRDAKGGIQRGGGQKNADEGLFAPKEAEQPSLLGAKYQRLRIGVDRLVAAAETQKSWRDWYDRHQTTLGELFGDDAPLFQKLLSATSQMASVKANVGLALKAYRQLKTGEPFTGYLPAVIKNLDRVRDATALAGPKISQYGKANEGAVGAIPVDRHIAELLFGAKTPTSSMISKAQDTLRTVAKRLGWEPRQVQAALWAFNQVRKGTEPGNVQSYDTILLDKADAIRALRSAFDDVGRAGEGEQGRGEARTEAEERAAEEIAYQRGGAAERRPGEPARWFTRAAMPDGSVRDRSFEARSQAEAEQQAREATPEASRVTARAIPGTEQGQRVHKELRDLIRRIAGSRVRLDTEGRLTDPQGQPVEGRYLKGVISVAMDAADPAGTARHEAVHFLREVGAIDAGAWRTLEKRAQQWRKDFNIDERYGDLSPAERTEEAIAEAYAAWGRGKLPKQAELAVRGVFNRIKQILAAVRDAVRKLFGQHATAEDVFAALEAGRFAEKGGAPGGVRSKDMLPAWHGSPHDHDRFSTEHIEHREKPNAARNYVIFSDADVKITAKYQRALNFGQTVTPAAVAQQVATLQPSLHDERTPIGQVLDHLRITFQDRFLPVMRLRENAERLLGRPLTPEEDAYLAEELMHGRIGEQKFRLDKDFKEPIIEMMRAAKLKPEQVDEYLTALHAEERNAYIAGINDKMPDGGSGMTNAEARAALAKATPELQRIGDLMRQMLDRTLADKVESGLVAPETAALWRQQYAHYVPLRGIADPDPDATSALRAITGRGFMGSRKVEPRATGRASRAPDVLATAFVLADEAIVRGEKNRVGQALVELARQAPDENVWELNPVETRARIVGGKVKYVKNPHYSPADTVTVREAGKEQRLQINQPDLLKALRGMDTHDNWIIQALGAVTRGLSHLNTTLSPEFILTNALMDAQTGIANIGAQDMPGLRRDVMKGWGKAFRGALHYQRKAKADTEWSRWAEEFRRNGGQTAFNRISDVGSEVKSLRSAVADLRGDKAIGQAILKIGRSIENANIAIDQAVRLSAYVALRKRNVAAPRAASVAKNLTVNFSRRGEAGAALNALYMFYNASVQGTAVMASALRSPKVRKLAYAAVALGVAQELAGMMIPPPDDDKDGLGMSMYDRIPEWVKQRNIIIPYGAGSGRLRLDPHALRLQSVSQHRAAHGRMAARRPRDDGQAGHAGRDLGKLGSSFMGAVAPAGLEGVLPLVPTIAEPFVENLANKDYFGSPISPEKYPATRAPTARSRSTGPRRWPRKRPTGSTASQAATSSSRA